MPTQSTASSFRKVLIVLLVTGAAVGCIRLVIGGFSDLRETTQAYALEARKAKLAAQREEFIRAVKLTGTPLVEHPVTEPSDLQAARARFAAIDENRHVSFQDAELSKTWAKISGDAEHGMQLLERISQVDRTKPSTLELGVAAMQQDNQGNTRALSPFERRIAAEGDKVLLTRELRRTQGDLDTSVAELQAAAGRIYSESAANQVRLRYLPSWSGTWVGDTVQLTNNSTEDLQDAVVFVSVYGRGTGSRTYAHYIDRWPAGRTVGAIYALQSSDFASARAGDTPDHVEAAIYVPGGAIKVSYELTQAELHDIVKGYCSVLRFTGTQLGPYTESGTGKQFPAGYQFSFSGLPTLPVTAVEIRFISENGVTRSETWHFSPDDKMQTANVYPFRSTALDGEPPARIEFALSFADTNFMEVVEGH